MAAVFRHLNTPREFDVVYLEQSALGKVPRGATTLYKAIRRYVGRPTDKNRRLLERILEKTVEQQGDHY